MGENEREDETEQAAARQRQRDRSSVSESDGRRTPQDLCGSRKVNLRLPGKGNSNSHDARPVHLIITMIKWIRTSRLTIKNSLFLQVVDRLGGPRDALPYPGGFSR